jgi:hypothetical protein
MQFYDKNGVEIKEFAVLKIFHYTARLRRKKCYMYKWVKRRNGELVGFHLTDDSESWFSLRAIANKETGIIQDAEIVQQY